MHSRSSAARIRQGGKEEIGAVPESGQVRVGDDKAEIGAKPSSVFRVASQLLEGLACSAMFVFLFANLAWAC